MALGLLALATYISCIFHIVCASFSALATRKLADAKADSGEGMEERVGSNSNMGQEVEMERELC